MELGLSRDFLDQNAPHKLVSLVGPVVPPFVYHQIEEELGTERLEAEEVKPLLEADPEVREVVGTAYAKHHEAHWILSMIDSLWTRHLTTMEELRHGINLQALAQRDPLVEYKRQSFNLFDDLKHQMRTSIVNNVMSIHLRELDAREQRALKKATRAVLTKQTATMRAQPPAKAPAKATSNGDGNGSRVPAGKGAADGASNGAARTPAPAGSAPAARPAPQNTPPRSRRPAQTPPRNQRGKPPRGKR
jgi:preprotein translocase subunit SecA